MGAMVSAEWNRVALMDRFRNFSRVRLGFVALAGMLSGCGISPGVGPVAASVAAISVTPGSVVVRAGATKQFTATTSGQPTIQWAVDGIVGGSISSGKINSTGLYTAPQVDPGRTVRIEAVSTSNQATGKATVTVTNPVLPMLAGVTYEKLKSSWIATQLPWIAELAGLTWGSESRSWQPTPGWTVPRNGVGPQIFYLYTALDSATEMAIAKQDVPLLEELASFHTALLQQRTTTVGAMLAAAPPGAYIFIAGPPDARTFVWDFDYTQGRIEISECQLCNARYLLSASRLMWAIAQMSPAERTPPLADFVSAFSKFIVEDQLLRLLYGTIPWSHWDNPNIPQPVVSAWNFLATTGYEPPHPIKYQAAMTDAELWLLADSAEVLGADAAAPELGILNERSRAQLQQAVAAGTMLLRARSFHRIAPDGADTLSTLAGDYDDHSDLAYSAYTGPETPAAPASRYGLMADAEHSSVLPPVFQALYETRTATRQSFPALGDLVSLANTYVHLAYNGDSKRPDFNNFIDGWNGWFRVGYPGIPGGYPPHQFCDSELDPGNCMTAGTLQGWGHLAVYNPDLLGLEQILVNLAYDNSESAAGFKANHYWYDGPYDATADTYPVMLVYFAGDSAGLVE